MNKIWSKEKEITKRRIIKMKVPKLEHHFALERYLQIRQGGTLSDNETNVKKRNWSTVTSVRVKRIDNKLNNSEIGEL